MRATTHSKCMSLSVLVQVMFCLRVSLYMCVCVQRAYQCASAACFQGLLFNELQIRCQTHSLWQQSTRLSQTWPGPLALGIGSSSFTPQYITVNLNLGNERRFQIANSQNQLHSNLVKGRYDMAAFQCLNNSLIKPSTLSSSGQASTKSERFKY